eukprot:CAMPEP_0118943548 /NCGR_PEP_ID=MMETSP1169-20130426/38534_1 /TAXON_ID=36882 /ORGANISM="Pyramimonas obovata, Strain CCMP722" /LENGTH=245 /DNA_ID=CAMNT_0006888829 /DNA_START=36 /DNA_END=773 /DNA_ORIENTATION=+
MSTLQPLIKTTSSGSATKLVTSLTVLSLFGLLILYIESGGKGPKQQLAPPTKTEYAAGQLDGLSPDLGVKVIDSQTFDSMFAAAEAHQRKRKMFDLTRDPPNNYLQQMMNTWLDGSYSPVHKHNKHSETFVILSGALAFFTFGHEEDSGTPQCHILGPESRMRGIAVEAGEWHAMTAAPKSLGYPGRAIVFETSGHKYNPKVSTKVLAPWVPAHEDGLNGSPEYFLETLLPLCPKFGQDPSVVAA